MIYKYCSSSRGEIGNSQKCAMHAVRLSASKAAVFVLAALRRRTKLLSAHF